MVVLTLLGSQVWSVRMVGRHPKRIRVWEADVGVLDAWRWQVSRIYYSESRGWRTLVVGLLFLFIYKETQIKEYKETQ